MWRRRLSKLNIQDIIRDFGDGGGVSDPADQDEVLRKKLAINDVIAKKNLLVVSFFLSRLFSFFPKLKDNFNDYFCGPLIDYYAYSTCE